MGEKTCYVICHWKLHPRTVNGKLGQGNRSIKLWITITRSRIAKGESLGVLFLMGAAEKTELTKTF